MCLLKSELMGLTSVMLVMLWDRSKSRFMPRVLAQKGFHVETSEGPVQTYS